MQADRVASERAIKDYYLARAALLASTLLVPMLFVAAATSKLKQELPFRSRKPDRALKLMQRVLLGQALSISFPVRHAVLLCARFSYSRRTNWIQRVTR